MSQSLAKLERPDIREEPHAIVEQPDENEAVISAAAPKTTRTHYVTLGGAQWPVEVTSNALGEPEKIEQCIPNGALQRTIQCKNGLPYRIIMHSDSAEAHPVLIVELNDRQRFRKISCLANDGSTIMEEGIFSGEEVTLASLCPDGRWRTKTVPVLKLYNADKDICKRVAVVVSVMPIEGLNLNLPECPLGAEVLDWYETGTLRTLKQLNPLGYPEVLQFDSTGYVFTSTVHEGRQTVIDAGDPEVALDARLIMREPGSVPEMFTTFYPVPAKRGAAISDIPIKYKVEFKADETGRLESFTVLELYKAGNTLHSCSGVPIEQWGGKVADERNPDFKIDTAHIKEKMKAIQEPYPLPRKNILSVVPKKKTPKVTATVDTTNFPDKLETKSEHGRQITYFWKGVASKDGEPVPRCVLKYSAADFATWNFHIHLIAITDREFAAGGNSLLKARNAVKEQLIEDLEAILPHHNQNILIDFGLVDKFDTAHAAAICAAETMLEKLGDKRKVLISGINGREDEVRERLIEGLKELLGDEIESRIQPEHLNALDPNDECYFLALARREDYDPNGRRIYSEDYRSKEMTGYREYDPKTGKPIQSETLQPKPIITTFMSVEEMQILENENRKKRPEAPNQTAVRNTQHGRKQRKHPRLAL